MLKALMKKMHNMQEQMGNFRREIKNCKENQMKG